MNNTDLPPLPPTDKIHPEVCALVKRYLAIAADLPDEQRHQLSYHLQHCPDCAREWRMLDPVTKAISHMARSQPSSQVDQAVMAAIAATTQHTRSHRRNRLLSRGSLVAALAACLSIIAIATLLFVLNVQQSFQLPANLSWNNYVLYHSQVMTGSDGKQYQIQTYHNLATNQMNVTTKMGNQLQVEAVSDAHQTLGMDTMHHVAQWDADAWSSDDSLFDLAQLRSDLQTGKAVYLGKETFQGQEVYRIRTAQGDILLLDSHYMPVNVLEVNQQADEPMYEQVSWLSPTRVPSSIWQMDIPQG
ncbi:MAG TPA: hypothetical protein VGN34_08525, partial [Ktedonobacteraceae bacterium]